LPAFKKNEELAMMKRIVKSLVTLGMLLFSIIAVSGAHGADEKDPYGGSREGGYGEKKEVLTPGDAEKMLKQYFAKKNVMIGEIREKELYFEAEVRDKDNKVIDKVIVDKRTGRIRSIY
jgi:hypothetical protein